MTSWFSESRCRRVGAGVLVLGLAAYAVGSYGLGTVADAFGRRKALIISLTLITAGTVLTALSWNLATLTIFRVITGLGMGAQISLASRWSASTPAPGSARGRSTPPRPSAPSA